MNRRRTLERSGVTMREIAASCGVSHTTVSFVLRGRTDMAIGSETRRRILEEAVRVDYHPQRNARLDAAKLRILYLCPDLRTTYSDFSMPMHVLVDLAEREEDADISFELVAYERPQLLDALYRGICEGQADGVVICRVGADIAKKVAALSPVPVFFLGQMDSPVCDTVSIADWQVGQVAARHFWERGHRSAAVLSVDMPVGRSRYGGFCESWRELGGDVSRVHASFGAFTPASGAAMLADYLGLPEPRPTAIFAANDTIAYGAIHALWERGMRVPEDVSIIGCDNMPYNDYTCPALTSMRLDTPAIAAALVRCIRARCLDGDESPPVCHTIATQLICRDSVATLRD